jgi:hypothetical protein
VAVRVAVGGIGVEALAALAGAVASVVVLVRGAELPGATAGLAVLGVALAGFLAAAGVALARGGRRWARSPVLAWQFLLVAMAFAGWTTAPAPWPAVVLGLAVVVVVALMTPAAIAWTARRPEPEDGP